MPPLRPGLAAMGRVAGRDEADLLDIQGFRQFLGHAQVAEVDRVEGAAEDADGSGIRRGWGTG
jgi:hypothetical protein